MNSMARKETAALELIEERTFTARLHDRNIAGLAVESTWEGFTKFRHAASGLHLIVLDGEKRVVTGSPALMSSLGLLADEHFVLIPQTTLPNGRVVPAFKYARYPASKGDNGRIVHDISAKPWVNITFDDAGAACEAAGYQVARETQELVVRHLICQQPENWTSGVVGQGAVYQGLHRGTVSCAQPADYQSDEGERNWHVLPGGEKLYGVAGNIATWTVDDVQGNDKGLVACRIESDSISLTTAPYPPRKKGMGYRTDGDSDWSGRALVRGGCWVGGGGAGVFRLDHAYPGGADGFVGFRCTKPA